VFDSSLDDQVWHNMVAADWKLGPRPLLRSLEDQHISTNYSAVYRSRERALKRRNTQSAELKRVNWRTFYDLPEWKHPAPDRRDESFPWFLRLDIVSRAFFQKGLPAKGVESARPYWITLSDLDPFIATYLVWELGCRHAVIAQIDELQDRGVQVPEIYEQDNVFADIEMLISLAPWKVKGLGGSEYQTLVERGIIRSFHPWAMYVTPLSVSDAEVPHVSLLREWLLYSLWNPPKTVDEDPGMTPRFAIDGHPINWNTAIHLAEDWDRDAWKEQQVAEKN
jgi:hypothetical protein